MVVTIMKRHIKLQLQHVRRRTWVSIGALAAGIVAVVTIGSMLVAVANRDADTSIAQARRTVMLATQTLDDVTTNPAASSNDIRTAFARYSASVQSQMDAVCQNESKQWYFVVSAGQSRCNKAKSALRTVGERLSPLQAYLDADTKIARIIASGVYAPTSYQQGYDSWNTTVTSINDVTVPDALSVYKTKLIKLTTVYRDAWKALVVADGAKDEVGFVAAEHAVTDAHAALKNAADDAKAPIVALSLEFTTAYRQFLSQTNSL
jgi:hypothetical protein